LYTNGNLDLDQFFQWLEKQAGIHKINQVKMAPWENIFDNISPDTFKNRGNKKIKRIESATQSGDQNRRN